MSNCNSCSGGCGGCSGCGGSMELTEGEIHMLLTLAQIPFLPVVRKMSDDIPVYLEDDRYSCEEYSLILQCLEKRGLIDIDYSKPLKFFSGSAYALYPVRGSFSLTARGQQVVELLEIQGIE